MDFQLTDEQLQLKKSLREFAEREILPNVMKWDEANHFPLETIKELGRMGVLGIIFAAHNSLCSNHIFLAGNEEQRKKYIPKLATGEWLGAWGLTEPGSGSDAGGARMSAVRKGKKGGWVLNGTKTFITNGHHANVAVVIAVTDKTAHTHGLSAFIVEKGTKGFRPGKKENKLGLRASDTSELIFEDCHVPEES